MAGVRVRSRRTSRRWLSAVVVSMRLRSNGPLPGPCRRHRPFCRALHGAHLAAPVRFRPSPQSPVRAADFGYYTSFAEHPNPATRCGAGLSADPVEPAFPSLRPRPVLAPTDRLQGTPDRLTRKPLRIHNRPAFAQPEPPSPVAAAILRRRTNGVSTAVSCSLIQFCGVPRPRSALLIIPLRFDPRGLFAQGRTTAGSSATHATAKPWRRGPLVQRRCGVFCWRSSGTAAQPGPRGHALSHRHPRRLAVRRQQGRARRATYDSTSYASFGPDRATRPKSHH